MSNHFDAESFTLFGLKVVIEDYKYKKELVVYSVGGSESLARMFEVQDKDMYRFTFGGHTFFILTSELSKLAETAEVRYYDQRSLLKLDRDNPTLASPMAAKN